MPYTPCCFYLTGAMRNKNTPLIEGCVHIKLENVQAAPLETPPPQLKLILARG